jgi:hypothetical protein
MALLDIRASVAHRKRSLKLPKSDSNGTVWAIRVAVSRLLLLSSLQLRSHFATGFLALSELCSTVQRHPDFSRKLAVLLVAVARETLRRGAGWLRLSE